MARETWTDLRTELLATPEAQEAYDAAARAFRLGELVRTARERAGISQAELARRVGSTQPSIARLEQGGVDPRLHTLERLGDALGMDLVVEFRPRVAAGVTD
ncbi:MAG: helix-turn-helix transcriptional regulator [Chloroflexi bacterium]|nr:helix-turn-helix transcriptional regulator [Chloroflexota bacterium]